MTQTGTGYAKVLIHGETEGEIDDDNRYLDVKVDQFGCIVIRTEDDENYIDTVIDVAEALALIRCLTEAIQDVT